MPRSQTLLAIFLLLSACGPMNSKQDAPGAAGQCSGLGDGSLTGPAALTGFSKNQVFIVQARVKDPKGQGYLEKAALGVNTFSIRLIHMDGLAPSGKDSAITIEYFRPNANIIKKFTAEAQRQDDGSFTTTIEFKKTGNWEIDVHATDSDSKDDHAIPLTI